MYHNFSFNNIEGTTYKTQIGFVDNSPSGEGLVLSRTVNNVRQKNTNGFYLTSSIIEEPLDLTIDIVRNGCDDNRYEFTHEEMYQILSWLRSTDNGELVIHLSNDENATLYGTFYEITEKNVGGSHVGYSAMFKATSPYIFGDEQTVTLSDRRLFTVVIPRKNYADLNYLCPKIQVVPSASGDLRISCTAWDEDCLIDDATAGEVITIDSKHEMFSSNNTASNSTLYSRFNYVFPKLYVDRGSESTSVSISTNINCDMTIQYTPLMLPVGIFN